MRISILILAIVWFLGCTTNQPRDSEFAGNTVDNGFLPNRGIIVEIIDQQAENVVLPYVKSLSNQEIEQQGARYCLPVSHVDRATAMSLNIVQAIDTFENQMTKRFLWTPMSDCKGFEDTIWDDQIVFDEPRQTIFCQLDGERSFAVLGVESDLPGQELSASIVFDDGSRLEGLVPSMIFEKNKSDFRVSYRKDSTEFSFLTIGLHVDEGALFVREGQETRVRCSPEFGFDLDLEMR